MWWILNKRDCLYTVWWAWVDHESGYLGIVTSWMNTNPPEQYESTKKRWIWSCNWLGKPKSCSYLTWEVFQVYAQCVHGITRLWVIISNKWKYFIRLNKNSGIWVPLPIVWYSPSLLPYKQRVLSCGHEKHVTKAVYESCIQHVLSWKPALTSQ